MQPASSSTRGSLSKRLIASPPSFSARASIRDANYSDARASVFTVRISPETSRRRAMASAGGRAAPGLAQGRGSGVRALQHVEMVGNMIVQVEDFIRLVSH